MKNKGFTLIEILFVISIIGFIGVIVSINLSKTMKQAHIKECKDFVSSIESSACAYYNLMKITHGHICNTSGMCVIINEDREFEGDLGISYLMEEGLIKTDVDPCTNDTSYLNDYVHIRDTYQNDISCIYTKGRNRYAE